MNIRINDQFSLATEKYGYKVTEHRRIQHKGEEKVRDIDTFHATLEQAFTKIARSSTGDLSVLTDIQATWNQTLHDIQGVAGMIRASLEEQYAPQHIETINTLGGTDADA